MKTSVILLAVSSLLTGTLVAPSQAEPILPPNVVYATLRTDGNTTRTTLDNPEFSALAVRDSLQCAAKNFGGFCAYFVVNSGSCESYSDYGQEVYNGLNDKTSSVDNDGTTCTFYQNTGCTGRTYQTSYNADLAGKFNDIISSFRC